MSLSNEETLETFKSECSQFAQIDKLISETKKLMKPLQDKLKQLSQEKKELEKDICIIMGENNLKQAQLQDNKDIIEYQVKQTVLPVTQKNVKDKMFSFYDEGPGAILSFNGKDAKAKGLEL